MKKVKCTVVLVFLLVTSIIGRQIYHYNIFQSWNVLENIKELENISTVQDNEIVLTEKKDKNGNLFIVRYTICNEKVEYVIIQVVQKEFWTFAKGKIAVEYNSDNFLLGEFNNTDFRIKDNEIIKDIEYENPSKATLGYIEWFESVSWMYPEVNATEIKLLPRKEITCIELEKEEFKLTKDYTVW